MKLTEEEKKKVEDNLALVNYLIKKYSFALNGSYDDYFQAGAYGLCLAVKRFDESRGTEFSTFASMYIIGYLKRYYRDFSHGPVRPPRSSFDNDNKPTYLYIDGLMNDETNDCFSGYDFIDAGEESKENEVITKIVFKEARNKLKEREKDIFDLLSKGATQVKIADELKISQAQVSRIQKKIKAKVNNFIRS
jgi:RNA polymerase sporulation-specific sigma factor